MFDVDIDIIDGDKLSNHFYLGNELQMVTY